MKINSSQINTFINPQSFKFNIILLYGPNNGLIDTNVSIISDILKIDVNNPFICTKLIGSTLLNNETILIDELTTLSLMGSQRFVFLNLFDITLSKKLSEMIKNIVSFNIDNSLLIIKADNLGSKNDIVKFIENSNNGLIIPCYDEEINDIKRKVFNIFKIHNLKFSSDFINLLSSKFSSNTSLNNNEFIKLSLFLDNEDNITENSLLELITDNTSLNISKITFYCASGDIENALELYEKVILSSIPPFLIIKNLIKHFKILEELLICIKNGTPKQQSVNLLKPPLFFKDKDKVLYQIDIWTLRRVNMVLDKLIDTDIKIRTHKKIKKVILAQTILSISYLAGKSKKI